MPLKQIPGKQFKCIPFSANEGTGLRKKKAGGGWACQPPKATRKPQTTSKCEDSMSDDKLKTEELYYETTRCSLEGELLLRNLKEEEEKKRLKFRKYY